MDQIPEWCPHGAVWRDCKDSACREIWYLAEAQFKDIKEQWALGYLAKRAAEEREEGKGDLEERKTAEEIELEQQLVKAWENQEKGRSDSGNRSGLPYDHITIRAMHQCGALSERQAKIAHLLLDLCKKPGSKVWEEIAADIGCSSRTVKRELQCINTLLDKKAKHVDYPPGSILIVKTRGEREPEYWLTREIRFRNWRRTWRELLTGRGLIRRLLREQRHVFHLTQTPYRQSPMNRLFGALIREFGQELKDPLNRLPDGAEWPPSEFTQDWEFNIQRAKKLLLESYPSGYWTVSQVFHALGKQSVLCNACRTPIMRGFRIGGRITSRRSKFCDDACRMKAWRSGQSRVS
jgi:hypothetical protein